MGCGEINPCEVLPGRPVRVEKTRGGVLPPERAGVSYRAMRKLAQPNSIVCKPGHYPGVVVWIVTLNQKLTQTDIRKMRKFGPCAYTLVLV